MIAHFDTVRSSRPARTGCALTGTRGSPPPDTLKVALNMLGGYRNTMTMVLTGLDIEEKAEHATQLLLDRLGGPDAFDETDVRLLRFDRPDAPTNEQATAHLRITVKSQDERAVGRAFSDATLELALGGYAGFYPTTPPDRGQRVRRLLARPRARGRRHPDRAPAGRHEQDIPHTATATSAAAGQPGPPAPTGHVPLRYRTQDAEPAALTGSAVPLGRLCGARSGDKGGNANVGFWARDDRRTPGCARELTIELLRELLPEAAELDVHRYELPNLRALNFVVGPDRPRRRRHHPAGRAGQGPRRVPALPHRLGPGRPGRPRIMTARMVPFWS